MNHRTRTSGSGPRTGRLLGHLAFRFLLVEGSLDPDEEEGRLVQGKGPRFGLRRSRIGGPHVSRQLGSPRDLPSRHRCVQLEHHSLRRRAPPNHPSRIPSKTPAARSVKLRGVLVSKGEHCSLPLTSPRLPRCSLSFVLHEDRTALFLPAAAGVPGRYGRVRAGSPSRRYSGAVLHLQRPRLAQCSLFTEASTPSRRARRPAFRRGEHGNSPTRKRSLDELEHRRSSPPAHHSVAAMPLSRSYKVTRI